jgi:dTDP-4-dehydrorhamnose 3,5-epimerase
VGFLLTSVTLISARRFSDARGYFAETYHRPRFSGWGIDFEFLQDNQSYSTSKGTVRGLHFQAPPHAQAKLVRVVRGRILDVAVDIRKGSPSYGRHVAVELSSEDGNQLFVPIGYLHGFVTLEPDTEVAYKVSNVYEAASEGGIHWRDPEIGVDWGVTAQEAALSDKDAVLPFLAGFESPFEYDGAPLELRTIG